MADSRTCCPARGRGRKTLASFFEGVPTDEICKVRSTAEKMRSVSEDVLEEYLDELDIREDRDLEIHLNLRVLVGATVRIFRCPCSCPQRPVPLCVSFREIPDFFVEHRGMPHPNAFMRSAEGSRWRNCAAALPRSISSAG